MRRKLDARYFKKEVDVPKNSFQAFRLSMKLTQEQLGEKCGLPRGLVSMYEAEKTYPTLNRWLRMKEVAAQNGIELSDTLFEDMMRVKAKRIEDKLPAKIQKAKEKMEALIASKKERIELLRESLETHVKRLESSNST